MITLTREEAQQVLEALEDEVRRSEVVPAKTLDAVAILFAKLAQPEPSVEPEKKYYKQTVDGKMDTVPAKGGLISEHCVEPVAWHEPGSYSNVTVYKKWAEENKWLPLYEERT